jgi:hypothetical protein
MSEFFTHIQQYTTDDYIDQNFCNRCEHQKFSHNKDWGKRQVIDYKTKCGNCFIKLPKYYASNFLEKEITDESKNIL